MTLYANPVDSGPIVRVLDVYCPVHGSMIDEFNKTIFNWDGLATTAAVRQARCPHCWPERHEPLIWSTESAANA